MHLLFFILSAQLLAPIFSFHLATRATFSCIKPTYNPLISAFIPSVKVSTPSDYSITVRNVLLDPHLGPVLLLGLDLCQILGLKPKIGKTIINRGTAKISKVFENAKVTFYDLDKSASTFQTSFYVTCEEGDAVQPRIGLSAFNKIFDIHSKGLEDLYATFKDLSIVRMGMNI